MRYCLLFKAYPGADMSALTNTRLPDGVIPIAPQTRIEVLPRGPMEWELRIDAVPCGLFIAATRDRYDELPPGYMQPYTR